MNAIKDFLMLLNGIMDEAIQRNDGTDLLLGLAYMMVMSLLVLCLMKLSTVLKIVGYMALVPFALAYWTIAWILGKVRHGVISPHARELEKLGDEQECPSDRETKLIVRYLPPQQLWAEDGVPTPLKWNPCHSGPYYYFMDFYVSAKHWDEGTTRMEQHFNKEVRRFMDYGNRTMWYAYVQAIRSLQRDDILIIFMPCASRERYIKRWEGLSSYLHQFGIRTGFEMVKVTETREIAHYDMTGEREMIRNYELSIPQGNLCVLLDDVRTTGRSFADLSRAVYENGSRVIGAISIAQVPLMQDCAC